MWCCLAPSAEGLRIVATPQQFDWLCGVKIGLVARGTALYSSSTVTRYRALVN